jgi:hypothetical protein
VLNRFASRDPIDDRRFLVLAVRGDDHADRLADRLRRCIAEHAFSRWIPRKDDAVQVFADDRVIRRGDQRSEQRSRIET